VRYCNPFPNARATNKDEYTDFANFDAKVGCYGNVPWAIGKKIRSLINGQIPTIRWKFCKNWSSRSWDIMSQMIFNRAALASRRLVSVCLSHAGIVSKRLNVVSRRVFSFLTTTVVGGWAPFPLKFALKVPTPLSNTVISTNIRS